MIDNQYFYVVVKINYLQCLILKLFWKTFPFSSFSFCFLFLRGWAFALKTFIHLWSVFPTSCCYNFFIKKSTPRINRGLFIMQKGELIGICFSSFPNYVFSKCLHFYFLFLCQLVKIFNFCLQWYEFYLMKWITK